MTYFQTTTHDIHVTAHDASLAFLHNLSLYCVSVNGTNTGPLAHKNSTEDASEEACFIKLPTN